jgi:hypothetical protein
MGLIIKLMIDPDIQPGTATTATHAGVQYMREAHKSNMLWGQFYPDTQQDWMDSI